MNNTDNHSKKSKGKNHYNSGEHHRDRHRRSNNAEKKESNYGKGLSRKKFKNYFTRESKALYSQPQIIQKHNVSEQYFANLQSFIEENPQCFTEKKIGPSNLSTKAFNPIKAIIVSHAKRDSGRIFHRESEKEKIPDWYEPGKDSKVVMNGKRKEIKIRTQ